MEAVLFLAAPSALHYNSVFSPSSVRVWDKSVFLFECKKYGEIEKKEN